MHVSGVLVRGVGGSALRGCRPQRRCQAASRHRPAAARARSVATQPPVGLQVPAWTGNTSELQVSRQHAPPRPAAARASAARRPPRRPHLPPTAAGTRAAPAAHGSHAVRGAGRREPVALVPAGPQAGGGGRRGEAGPDAALAAGVWVRRAAHPSGHCSRPAHPVGSPRSASGMRALPPPAVPDPAAPAPPPPAAAPTPSR